ncbi:MAG TPA: Fic family protein [Fibrobacteraceae bacterium]|nr:Fic family protein [Fibrobacteraceae bacterium]
MKRPINGSFRNFKLGGEVVRAFVPGPLPPQPALEFTDARRRLLERATLALGRLDSVVLLLPDSSLFLYSYVRREAVLSSQIEGTQSSFSDLLLFELKEAPGIPMDDAAEVSNYVAALEHGVSRMREGFPLCNRLLREVHGVLLSRGRGSEKNPGEFRQSQNWIGGTRPGNAHYVPPPLEDMEQCLAELEKFFHDENAPYPILLKAALIHVQFESIHPFLDGNGRVGRLLVALLLHSEGLLSQPLLYLSLYLKQHRSEYYRLLDAVRSDGDWEAWVDFFLEGVEATANEAVHMAKSLVSLFQEDATRIQGSGRNASTLLRIHQALCKRPVLNIQETIKLTGLSFPPINKAMNSLAKLGIIQELTGARRNRVFAYRQYMQLLSEGTEAQRS